MRLTSNEIGLRTVSSLVHSNIEILIFFFWAIFFDNFCSRYIVFIFGFLLRVLPLEMICCSIKFCNTFFVQTFFIILMLSFFFIFTFPGSFEPALSRGSVSFSVRCFSEQFSRISRGYHSITKLNPSSLRSSF